MNRDQKVTVLLARAADDERRLALNELDRIARETNTFGSKEHRAARDQVERTHDDTRRFYQSLPEEDLDRELATTPA